MDAAETETLEASAAAAGDPIDPVEPVTSVSTLELFFDLVFVFTTTQLTALLFEDLAWRTVWHVVVMLGLIFWMYDGYAWLTNAVPTEGKRRQLLLLGGMAGYLVVAIAIPRTFSGAGLTFGLAYLAINLIHSFLYVTGAGESSAAAMRTLAPWNLLAAIAVTVGGAIGGDVQLGVWTAVVLSLWLATRVNAGFEVGPAHFVERHGLLVLVAIGESVVATGAGARGLPINVELVAVAVLGLLLSAGLWSTYFGDPAEHVEAAFRRLRGHERARAALIGFGYGHYLILLGVIFASVGVRHAVAHPGATLSLAEAVMLCGGVALFLIADGWFRTVLGLEVLGLRLPTALAVLVAIPLATSVSAITGLAATALLLAAAHEIERRRSAVESATAD